MLLKVGSKGELVKRVQQVIGTIADGIFGKGTEDAVKKYQYQYGLTVDGLVGRSTLSHMGLIDNSLFSGNLVEKNGLSYIEYFLPPNEYKEGPKKMEYAFLHHTAGWHNPYKTIEYWDRDNGTIGTEWVLGGSSIKGDDEQYDGELVQCFPEGNYAWHLGKNGSQYMHIHSVGIEVCNFGYIENGRTYAGTIADESQIVTLNEEFRGYKKWHRYSDNQIEKLEYWLRFIAERDGIDITKGLPELVKKIGAKAFEFNEDAYYGRIKGVWTHSNTRKDKFDMFPQQELLDMLSSL